MTSYFGETLDFSLFPEPEVVFTNKEKVQKEVKAALSENATLSCEVAQEKTEVKWYKDGKLITSSKKLKVESEGKSRRLVVGQVEKKDAGEYSCEAAGQKLTFRIDVTGRRIVFLITERKCAPLWAPVSVQPRTVLSSDGNQPLIHCRVGAGSWTSSSVG